MATAHFGLHRTALAYCVAMAALIAAAVGSLMLRMVLVLSGFEYGLDEPVRTSVHELEGLVRFR